MDLVTCFLPPTGLEVLQFFNDFRTSRLKLLLRCPLLNTVLLFLLERIIMIPGLTDEFGDYLVFLPPSPCSYLLV